MSNIEISADDKIILESLIRSPAFSVLKKVLNSYREQCHSILLSAKDTHTVFQTQGRIIGINVVEQLPSLLVAQQKQKEELERKKKDLEEKRKQRMQKTGMPPTGG